MLSASVGDVNVVLFADTEESSFGGKVQLTSTTVLKYTSCENKLVVALDILDTATTYLEFARDEDENVLGIMYEYLTAGDKTVTATSTMILVDDTYTTLIGTKGDKIPTAIFRNCEVYNNATGELVGTEVKEELTFKKLGVSFTATYNTLWYNLNDVTGISNIKKVDEPNGTNADTIYINDVTSDTIHVKLGCGDNDVKKALSRSFDIEFKTMYFYQYNSDKEEYEEVSCEIPMIFVQEENLGTFLAEFSDANADYLSSDITWNSQNVSQKDREQVYFGYYTLLTEYEKIKDAVTHDMISNYCKA